MSSDKWSQKRPIYHPRHSGPRLRLDASTCISIGTIVSSRRLSRISLPLPPNTFRWCWQQWSRNTMPCGRCLAACLKRWNVFCPETSDRRKTKEKKNQKRFRPPMEGERGFWGRSGCFEKRPIFLLSVHAHRIPARPVAVQPPHDARKEAVENPSPHGPSCNTDRRRNVNVSYFARPSYEIFFSVLLMKIGRNGGTRIAIDAPGQSVEKQRTVRSTSPRADGVCGRTF